MPLTTLQSLTAPTNGRLPAAALPGALDVKAIGDLLAHAFDYDPVTRWLVPDHDRHHRVITGLFTVAATDALAQGTLDVLTDDAGAPIAAALWFDHTRATREDAPAPTAARTDASSATWRAPFAPDTGRWDTFDDLMSRHHLDGPHLYPFAIGVDPSIQGRGLGSHLLTHAPRRRRPFPIYLEATSPASRRVYLRHGYTDLGQIQPPTGPPLWRIWRPSDGACLDGRAALESSAEPESALVHD